MMRCVLDTSVIVAVIAQERGYENALPFLDRAIVSTVNLAEVAARFARHGMPQDSVETLIQSVHFAVKEFTQELSLITGMLIQKTRPLGLSLGDRACLALAISKNLPVLTADKAWKQLELPIEVKLLR